MGEEHGLFFLGGPMTRKEEQSTTGRTVSQLTGISKGRVSTQLLCYNFS